MAWLFPTDSVRLTQGNLDEIKSLNDRISIEDVQGCIFAANKINSTALPELLEWQMQKGKLLQRSTMRIPYIIGIAGSVAVGKSTIARLISILLNKMLPDKRVELMTTDGFLYSQCRIKTAGGSWIEKASLNHMTWKGSSSFLMMLRQGNQLSRRLHTPHQVYDVQLDKPLVIDRPDILIVEGSTRCKLPSVTSNYMSVITLTGHCTLTQIRT